MTKSVLQQTGDNGLLTPAPILRLVRQFVGDPIPLDPCTTEANPTGAARTYTQDRDGLGEPWIPGTFWNPPFGAAKRGGPSQCYAWAAKAREEARGGAWSVGLLPCDTGRQSSRAWHEHVLCPEMACYAVLLGRTRFDRLVDGERVVGGGGRAPTYTTGLYLYVDTSDGIARVLSDRLARRFFDVFSDAGAVMGPRIR